MKLTEQFVIAKGYNISSWGHRNIKLKYKHETEHNNEVKTYKLSKEELEKYLKDINTRPIYRKISL